MKRRLLTTLVFVLAAKATKADVVLPGARGLAEASRNYDDRANAVINFYATLPLEDHLGLNFGAVAVAKLLRPQMPANCAGDQQNLNVRCLIEALNSRHVTAKPGTDFETLTIPVLDVRLCGRTGDYDMSLIGLVRMMYLARSNPGVIDSDTYARVLHELLNQRGGADQVRWRTTDGLCGASIDETENHILMTETSRYLTNQLLAREAGSAVAAAFDNARNGMNDFMLSHLQKFLKNDFQEFNARRYQGLSIMAIENLFDFADDARVHRAAGILLDYLSAKFAVSSNGLRRIAPFRRKIESAAQTDFFRSAPQKDVMRDREI